MLLVFRNVQITLRNLHSQPLMELLTRKGNDLNPDVLFDPNTGNLSIEGKSIPMGVDSFLSEVVGWNNTQKIQRSIQSLRLI